MPERSYSAENTYRYGFNGKESDQEFRSGAFYDYGFRVYDTRVGKFFSVDPLSPEYPHYSPYQFAGNSPILFYDMDGLERYYAGDGSIIGVSGNSTLKKVVSNEAIVQLMRSSVHNFNKYRDQWSKAAKSLDANPEIHQAAIDMVKAGAEIYKAKAELSFFSKRAKEANMEAYSLLLDFANGSGPAIRIYDQGHPFSDIINEDNQLINEVAKDLSVQLINSKMTVEQYFNEKKSFIGGYAISPDHLYNEEGVSGVGKSIYKHLKALLLNPIEFVVGGMSYTVTPILNPDKAITGYNIQYTNISGKESLLLHQATNVDATLGYQVPLSNKKQVFNFTISKEELQKLVNEQQ